tara:strand:+ start:196 stop:399 length:204 start_codon:yes stop_codon:yes gene_type:complete
MMGKEKEEKFEWVLIPKPPKKTGRHVSSFKLIRSYYAEIKRDYLNGNQKILSNYLHFDWQKIRKLWR